MSFLLKVKLLAWGLDKTAKGYQDEGVIKLLKDIRDALAGGVNIRPNDNDGFDNDGFDNGSDDYGSFDDDGSDDDDDYYYSDDIKKIYNNLLLKYFQLRKNMNETKDDTSKELKDELDKIKDELDKTKDGLDKTKHELDKKEMILMVLI